MSWPIRTLLAAGALLLAAAGAQAATIPVTTTLDGPITDPQTNDGLCSLREAVAAARYDGAVQGCPAGSGADVVALPAGIFTLTTPGFNEDPGFTGDLDVGGPAIRVSGAGAGASVIVVGGGDRAFDVLPGGDLALEALTIRGARLPDDTGASGAGVRNQGRLSVVRVAFEDNVAGQGQFPQGDGGGGGAIWSGNPSAESVAVVDSTFTANSGGAGGVPRGNGGNGGAIRIASGALSVSGSTFAGNAGATAAATGGRGGSGGAIAVGPGTATVSSSTFASNRGGPGGNTPGGIDPFGGNGGAIWVTDGGQALVEWSTFVGNLRGGGSAGPNGIAGAIVGGSILADPEPRCVGVTASSRNLLSSPDTACLPGGGSLVGDPRLGLLAANGGPTLTFLPGAGSAAIDVAAGGCPATDQRGLPRPRGAGCDLGAVEVQPGEPGASAPAPPGAGGPAPATRVATLSLTPAAFRAAPRGASVGAPPKAKALQQATPVGTTVRYRLDGAARVTFTVTRALPGRRKGPRCVAPGAARPGATRCTRTKVLRGSFAHQGAAGPNSFRFSGRLRGRKLAPGPYRLVAKLPAPAKGKAALKSAAFRIVR